MHFTHHNSGNLLTDAFHALYGGVSPLIVYIVQDDVRYFIVKADGIYRMGYVRRKPRIGDYIDAGGRIMLNDIVQQVTKFWYNKYITNLFSDKKNRKENQFKKKPLH